MPQRRVRLTPAAARVKSPVPQRVHGVCVACGGRNVIRVGSRLPQVQCRSCGVVSPDFIQPKPPSGYQDDGQSIAMLDKNQCHAMLDELLDALAQEKTMKKAQTLLNRAKGDVVLIYHFYVPFVLDACGRIVARYGFSSSTEGVKESLRVVQRHATTEDDGLFTQKLMRLRRVLTPTGSWIKEDAEADAEELKKKKEEQEATHRKQEEAKRMEAIAAENAKKAKLRAKKIALGLDPTIVRLPFLESTPPRTVVAYSDETVVLRVVARYTYHFQWFCNSKSLCDEGISDDGLYRGAQRSTLTIRRLTKRTVGEYYCVCTNDEGVVSSPSTQVQTLALGSRTLASRKVTSLPSGGLVSLTLAGAGHSTQQQLQSQTMVSLSAGGSLSLLHSTSLAPVSIIPPIPLPPATRVSATAWLATSKSLAIATTPLRRTPALQPRKKTAIQPPTVCEVSVYAVDIVPPPPVALPSTSSPVGVKGLKPHTKVPDGKPTHDKNGSPSKPSPQGVLSRHVGTHRFPGMKSVECVLFLDCGRLLLASDLHNVVQIFELTPAFTCKRTLRFDHPQHPLCDIATTHTTAAKGAFAGFALCVRHSSQIELFNFEMLESQRLDFKLPVHRAAFDSHGFALAVAEMGSIKSWVTIVSVQKRTPIINNSRRRFIAHVGKISSMQWTTQSSLLLTSGYDGYVKLWDLNRLGSDEDPACVFRMHLDFRGIRSLLLIDDPAAQSQSQSPAPLSVVAAGFTDCRLHARELLQLQEFEATRRIEHGRSAAQIQKIWKGRRTRDLIDKFIRSKQ